MTATFAPVREARRLWERSQPQMFFEVDDLSTRSAVEQLVAREPHQLQVAGSSPARALLPEVANGHSASSPFPAECPPAAPTNSNGSGGS